MKGRGPISKPPTNYKNMGAVPSSGAPGNSPTAPLPVPRLTHHTIKYWARMVAPPGFEPGPSGPKPNTLDRYATGLLKQ